jgi:hypothetical protein
MVVASGKNGRSPHHKHPSSIVVDVRHTLGGWLIDVQPITAVVPLVVSAATTSPAR